jgi:hypothetical protein
MRVPFFQKKPSEAQRQFVMVTLSPEGLKEAENFEAAGDEFEVLSALTQKRPQSLGSLAKSANMPFNKCLQVCKELKLKGYIQQVQRSS